MKVKVFVDKNKCIGCGLCQRLLPEIFALGETGLSEVKKQEVELSENLKEAEKNCPVSAIRLESLE